MNKTKASVLMSAAVLLMVMALQLAGVNLPALRAGRASADIVTCNNGSVHDIPNADYACVAPGENGVKSVAPSGTNGTANKPGDVCPQYFARAGQTIPAGQDGTWCSTIPPEQADCQKRGGTWDDKAKACSNPSANDNAHVNPVPTDCVSTDGSALNTSNCGILRLVKEFSNFLSAAAGVVVVIMIIVGAIQYTTAADNPAAVAAAKAKIRNAIIAILMWIFMFSFLQWIVPGGLF